MSGRRQPTDVVKANGRKHLSQAEEAERRAGEVRLLRPKKLKPPDWLPEYLKPEFRALAKQLLAADMGMAQLDADTLGQYLVARRQYVAASRQMQDFLDQENAEEAAAWSHLQEKYFKQARACAGDMGLTLSSRCKLVVPRGADDDQDKANPFLQVIQGGKAANG